MRRIDRWRRAATALAALGLSACLGLGGPAMPTRMFVLAPLAGQAAAPSGAWDTGPAGDLAVGVGPLAVPEYAATRLVTRVGPNEVALSETERWAEPLAAGVQRVVVTNLAALLPSERVLPHPWRPELSPTWRIDADVVRFERGPDGAAQLEVHWRLRRASDLALVRSGTARFAHPTAGDGPDALVAALSEAVAAWSRELAAALLEVSVR